MSILDKILPRQDFDSYEDFKANYTANIPKGFNFGYDCIDAWADEQDDKPALAWTNDDSDEVKVFSFGDLKRMSILSVQMKVFATDKDGVPFVPEDTACCFILND